MLTLLRKNAMAQASILRQTRGINYETVNVNILADGYCDACDAGNEDDKNLFISALILRFWYTIKKMQDKSPNIGEDITEFASWLYEAIEYACKYRAWRDPSKKVNAQQAINQCIETIRLQHYYQYNLKKNKSNFNIVSLDNLRSFDEDDSAVSYLDSTEDEYEATKMNESKEASGARVFIQRYIDKSKLIEAIILDTIAFNNSEREIKKVSKFTDMEGNEMKLVNYTFEFWQHRCVQLLSELPDTYKEYFLENYKVNPAALQAAIDAIKKANNQKLHFYIKKCLEGAKTSFGGTF